MNRLLALLAPVAILLPLLAADTLAQDAAPARPGANGVSVIGFDPLARQPFDTLDRARQDAVAHQVRVESRVVIRIRPAASTDRRRLMSSLPRRPMRARFSEVDHGDCVDVESIIGVQPTTDNRLLVYTDERQILAAALEDGCSARAFYAGFYVEKNEDKRLCVGRDRLQSRAGASCEVTGFTRLVAVAE